MTKTQLLEQISSDVLIQSANELADELLATDQDAHYYPYLEETFDLTVAELTARGLWYGEFN